MKNFLNKIHARDCVALLRELSDDCVDLVIADPPYNIGKDFGISQDNMPLDDYVEWARSWVDESLRVLKPNGIIYIYGFAEIIAHLAVHYPTQKQHWLAWHYKNKAVPASKFWQRSHEVILTLWQGERPHLNIDAIREPYSEVFLKNAAGKIRKETPGRYAKGNKKTVYQAHENGALPRDVLQISALAGGAGYVERWFYCKNCKKLCEPKTLEAHREHDIIKHPTQKPFALTRRLIDSVIDTRQSNKGLVMIPFAGSGAECVVAREMGVDFIASEINPDYVLLGQAWLVHEPCSN